MLSVEQLIVPAVTQVFGTMLGMKTETLPDQEVSPPPPEQSMIAGSIGFTGLINFVIYLTLTDKFARHITCTLLQITDRDVDGHEMVNDAIGELTNMVAGYVKTRLCDQGQGCSMTPPMVVRGKDFTIAGAGLTECRFLHFRCKDSGVTIQIILKPR